MEHIIIKTSQHIIPRIPDELIYEIINGNPVYYKGYKDVIKQHKQII